MRAILTFHSVDDSGSVISYPPARFWALLECLGRAGLPVVDLDTLLAPGFTRGVALTFDDGMRSVLQHALPALKAHRVPAHLFLTTGPVGRPEPWPDQPSGIPSFPMLSWAEVERLVAGGVHIENHTHTHPDMRALSVEAMSAECEQSDALIAEHTGRRPRYFAYPFGYFGPAAQDFARARYHGTVTTELRALGEHEDPAALPRLDTFYLKSEEVLLRLASAPVQAYLSARSVLRTLRGSQVIPESGPLAALRRAFL
jgi:peptidoglycan/xylan/chitin deacetylase (PgdA/CDA1 family)